MKIKSNLRISNTSSWVSVEEALPEINKEVLVRIQGHDWVNYVEDYLGLEGEWNSSGGFCVTHWIPMPKVKCPTCGVIS